MLIPIHMMVSARARRKSPNMCEMYDENELFVTKGPSDPETIENLARALTEQRPGLGIDAYVELILERLHQGQEAAWHVYEQQKGN